MSTRIHLFPEEALAPLTSPLGRGARRAQFVGAGHPHAAPTAALAFHSAERWFCFLQGTSTALFTEGWLGLGLLLLFHPFSVLSFFKVQTTY